jgi:hypothetical protein
MYTLTYNIYREREKKTCAFTPLYPQVPNCSELGSQGSGWTCDSSPEGVPIIDRRDCIFPGEGHSVTSARVSFGFLVLGEGA